MPKSLKNPNHSLFRSTAVTPKDWLKYHSYDEEIQDIEEAVKKRDVKKMQKQTMSKVDLFNIFNYPKKIAKGNIYSDNDKEDKQIKRIIKYLGINRNKK